MDYVYIPLGGNRCPFLRHLMNLLITFVISGIWHGANWTFLLWGALHGVFMIFSVLKNKYLPAKNENSLFRTVSGIVFTFGSVMVLWIFFRARDVSSAFLILKKIFTDPGPVFKGEGIPELLLAFLCIALLLFKEIKDELGWNIRLMQHKNSVVCSISMALMICLILLTGVFSGKSFIYFQF
jgi:hypothetical protein